MKNLPILLATVLVGFTTVAAHADPVTLQGSKVRADLFALNDSTQTNVLLDPLATVGGGIEFTYDDKIETFEINVNATGFSLHYDCDAGIKLKKCETDPGFGLELKDNLFAGAAIDLTVDTIGVGGGIDPLNPKILLIIVPPPDSLSEKAVFNVTPAPEPSSFVFLGTGVLSLAGIARRRFRV